MSEGRDKQNRARNGQGEQKREHEKHKRGREVVMIRYCSFDMPFKRWCLWKCKKKKKKVSEHHRMKVWLWGWCLQGKATFVWQERLTGISKVYANVLRFDLCLQHLTLAEVHREAVTCHCTDKCVLIKSLSYLLWEVIETTSHIIETTPPVWHTITVILWL